MYLHPLPPQCIVEDRGPATCMCIQIPRYLHVIVLRCLLPRWRMTLRFQQLFQSCSSFLSVRLQRRCLLILGHVLFAAPNCNSLPEAVGGGGASFCELPPASALWLDLGRIKTTDISLYAVHVCFAFKKWQKLAKICWIYFLEKIGFLSYNSSRICLTRTFVI